MVGKVTLEAKNSCGRKKETIHSNNLKILILNEKNIMLQ